MAANAKQDLALETAIEGWSEAAYRRNDYGERRRLGIRSKTTPYLMPDDVATLNKIVNEEDKGRRTSDMFFPEDAKEDGLRVEIIAPLSTTKPSVPPSYFESRPKTTTAKKKRVREETPEDDASGEPWRRSKDGRSMIKRVRNLLVRRPLDELEKEASEEVPESSDSEPSSSDRARRRPLCAWHAPHMRTLALCARAADRASRMESSSCPPTSRTNFCLQHCRPMRLLLVHQSRRLMAVPFLAVPGGAVSAASRISPMSTK